MMRTLFVTAAVALVVIVLGGCAQNELSVCVERVVLDDEGAAQLREDSRYGRMVLATVGAMQECGENYYLMRRALEAASEEDDAITAYAAEIVNRLGEGENEFDRQIGELMGLFEEPDATGMAPRINWMLMRAKLLLGVEATWMGSQLEDLARDVELKETAAKRFRELKDREGRKLEDVLELSKRIAIGAAEDIRRIGFGGFLTVGVFEINPADPMYRKILAAECVTLSCDSFTCVRARIDGDSSIMFVMESPGQIRIYQIQNDPTQLLRNIAILIQKATAAATKMLSQMLMP